MTLQFQIATREQQVAAFSNSHEMWGRGRSIDEYIERCTRGFNIQQATGYVGCLAGEVVCALVTYPVAFSLDSQRIEGFKIGSVHTRTDSRQRGYAAQLIAWVEAQEQARGARMSILYSDIKPAYYEKLGYQTCASHQGKCQLSDLAAEAPRSAYELVRFDPADESDQIAALYARDHLRSAIAIDRDENYWQIVLEKQSQDEFYLLMQHDRPAEGYLRVSFRNNTASISDFAIDPEVDGLEQSMYAGLLELAAERGVNQIDTWLPTTPTAREIFEVTSREIEITMIKPLDESLTLADRHLAAADRFTYIDHV